MKTPQVNDPSYRYYLPSFVAASAGYGPKRRKPRLPLCTVGICRQPAEYADIWCREHRGMNNGD